MDNPSPALSRKDAGERAAAGAGLSMEIDDDGIAVIKFDQPGVEHNRFTPELLERLGAVLDDLNLKSRYGDLAGVLLTSAKPESFLVGVDVAAIAAVRDEATAVAATRRGQEIFHKLAVLPVPTVAAINGTCLGGATEMALACTWRIAADSPEFEIGLPEVNLGIFPGFGGSQRLPRTISLERSLQMIVTGRSWNARRAYKAGLIDSVVAPPILVVEARRWLREEAPPRRAMRRAPEDRGFPRRLRRWLLEGQPLGRSLVFRQARKRALAQTGGHYPAPLQAIDTVRRGLRMPLLRALELEAERVGRLVVSPVARNLIGIFFSRSAARRVAKGAAAPTVGKLAVVGAGVMGGGIAQLAAYHGIPVRMKDVAPEALTTGLAVANKRFKQRRQRAGKLSKIEAARHMDLISPTLDYTGFATVDLVVEAVVERLDVKRSVLAEIEAVTRPETILATNTSSLTLADLAQSLNRPEQLVGLHFFNPVHRMPLVEVVRGEGSSAEAVNGAVAFAGAMGKVPVVIGDAPGFFVNRVLGPYLNEAVMMVEAGVGIERIDRALRRFGMPMGPLRLLDEIGIDVSDHAAAALGSVFGDRLPATSANRKLREAGRLGRKVGRGFYRYEGKREQPDASIEVTLRNGVAASGAPPDTDIVDRCVLLILNETCMALGEGIVESPRMADLALVMGTGFAPFRGGILRYADEIGVGRARDRLQELAERYGARFTPAALLAEMADSGGTFYPDDWPVP